MVQEAVLTASGHSRPGNASDTLRTLAALNLLNAAVKQPWGKRVVGYPFIKGHAAHLMAHLLAHPQADVSCYLDRNADVAYFCVCGIQVSFHHIPLTRLLRHHMKQAVCSPQAWNNLQLQRIAADFETWAGMVATEMNHAAPSLFGNRISGKDNAASREAQGFGWNIGDRSMPVEEDRMESLREALRFHIWDCKRAVLYSPVSGRTLHLMRYDGSNYHLLTDYLIAQAGAKKLSREESMAIGRFYHVTHTGKMRASSPHSNLFWLSRFPFLLQGDSLRCLLLTYDIARWLAHRFPRLVFVYVPEFRIVSEQVNNPLRHFYTLSELLDMPADAPQRAGRTWLPVDTAHFLHPHLLRRIPNRFLDAYMTAEYEG
ncbi:MAG: hypothetical protein IJ692_04545 [Alloprevotella sp.]|nr:hypothetical protein [Alloprevotella sp.]